MNEEQEEFLIEENSQNSKYKETYINNSFRNTNSRDLSANICRVCGGKIINENNYNYNYNYRYNNEYRNINNNVRSANKKVNVINNKIYKTLLTLPINETKYISNIEIGAENRNNILFSDDEFIKEKRSLSGKKYKNKIQNKYDNKSFYLNHIKSKNINNLNNLNFANSEICNYSQNSDENNLKQNNNTNYRINKKVVTNTILRKNNYKQNTNDNNIINRNNNDNFYQIGSSRYTYYRNLANSGQNETQLKTMVINHNRKRKLFRFEEGKGIKVIYQ